MASSRPGTSGPNSAISGHTRASAPARRHIPTPTTGDAPSSILSHSSRTRSLERWSISGTDAHSAAQPRPMVAVRVVGKRPAARLRHNLWSAGRQVKQWIKRRVATAPRTSVTGDGPDFRDGQAPAAAPRDFVAKMGLSPSLPENIPHAP